jgi:hypothetical protein
MRLLNSRSAIEDYGSSNTWEKMMAQRLKSWESPRRKGRNDKGRGGSARQRQRRKQWQQLRQNLKRDPAQPDNSDPNQSGDSTKKESDRSPFLMGV